jgi:serine phosphatase RsbU (regulator of sigma subunit)
MIDNRAGMRVAVEHLLRQHECRRIAYVSGPQVSAEANARLEGYRDALRECDVAYDEALIAYGHFNVPTGQAAMREILGRTREFDAVVAANDYMAIGAMDVMREHSLRTPEDVLVVSFDDAPVARLAARSLTTVAQPMDQMADQAVRDLLLVMRGQKPADVSTLRVNLVLRESCGCGYLVRSSSIPPVSSGGNVLDYLRVNRDRFLEDLQPTNGSSKDHWPRWAPRLLDALTAELSGSAGVFLRVLEDTAEEAALHEISVDELALGVATLRRDCHGAGFHGATHVDLEKIWMKALTILSAAATRLEGRTAMDLLMRANGMRYASQRLSIALDPTALAAELLTAFDDLEVQTGFVALTTAADANTMSPLVMVENQQARPVSPAPYPNDQLFPVGFPSGARRASMIVMALTFEKEVLGVLAVDANVDPFVCESLRSQVGASLKIGALHKRVVEETSLRERLGQEQLRGEMGIAKRIQTALAPKRLEVPSLEIVGGVRPADLVGGDYYDVLPVPGGCWIGMGDVTGHGLLSGLIMLMIQSMVSALVAARPDANPSDLVVELNRVLSPNIRERLGEDQHATFMLLRYFSDGRVRFAGAHEDVIVCRHRTRRCEVIATTGLWIGIVEDIRDVTTDSDLELERGDLLVVYTDGLIEARNAVQEQFGIERVCALIEACADRPADAIHATLMSAVGDWSVVQQDDVTCIVARYVPSTDT